MELPEFKVGMIFPTAKVFKDAAKKHVIKTGKKIKFVKNDSYRVRVICQASCKWVILASRMQGEASL